jgi:hypothetical protein
MSANAASTAELQFPTSQGWTHPVGTGTGPFNDWLFGTCNSTYIDDRAHLGADSQGTGYPDDVRTIAPGVVVAVDPERDYRGDAIAIQHRARDGTRFVAVYMHLDTTLKAGAALRQGEKIGVLRKFEDDHLHIGINPLSGGENFTVAQIRGDTSCTGGLFGYVNPIPFLASRQPGYQGWVVKKQGDDTTAFLVGENNKRRWIRDGRTYNCLVGNGHPFAGSLPDATIATLQDIQGKWAPCQGDTNGDYRTNITDLSILLSNYGMSTDSYSDLNGDGVVNIVDLSILLSNYGKSY